MPFKSKSQRRWMYANDPEMASRWEKHTPDDELPEKVGEAIELGRLVLREIDEEDKEDELFRNLADLPTSKKKGVKSLWTRSPEELADLTGRWEEATGDAVNVGTKDEPLYANAEDMRTPKYLPSDHPSVRSPIEYIEALLDGSVVSPEWSDKPEVLRRRLEKLRRLTSDVDKATGMRVEGGAYVDPITYYAITTHRPEYGPDKFQIPVDVDEVRQKFQERLDDQGLAHQDRELKFSKRDQRRSNRAKMNDWDAPNTDTRRGVGYPREFLQDLSDFTQEVYGGAISLDAAVQFARNHEYFGVDYSNAPFAQGMVGGKYRLLPSDETTPCRRSTCKHPSSEHGEGPRGPGSGACTGCDCSYFLGPTQKITPKERWAGMLDPEQQGKKYSDAKLPTGFTNIREYMQHLLSAYAIPIGYCSRCQHSSEVHQNFGPCQCGKCDRFVQKKGEGGQNLYKFGNLPKKMYFENTIPSLGVFLEGGGDEDTSVMCDTGYHARCRGCGCACHG